MTYINVYIIYLVVMGSTSKFVQFHVLLVDFTKVLFSSAKELQQTSNVSSKEEYIPPISTVLLELHRVYIWPSWPFVFCLSFVNNSPIWNFCRWVADVIPRETSSAAKSEEKRLFSQANWKLAMKSIKLLADITFKNPLKRVFAIPLTSATVERKRAVFRVS